MPAPRIFENGAPRLLEGTTTVRLVEGAAAAPPNEAVGTIAGTSTVTGIAAGGSVGAAAGTSTGAGVATAFVQAAGAAAGTSTVSGVSDTAAPNVWNSADKNAGITLSNSDATAAISSGSGYRGVRGLRLLDGTHLVVMTVNYSAGNDFAFGIANLTASLSNWVGVDNNSIGYYAPGTVYRNGGSVGSSGSYATGSSPELEIDAVAQTVRFRNGSGGTWSGTFSTSALGAGPYRLIWATDQSGTENITIIS